MLGTAIGLVRQVSSGPDGIRYIGMESLSQTEVDVARLFLAHQNPRRFHYICERVTLASYVEHDTILRPRSWYPEGQDPYLVTDRYPRTLGELVGSLDRERIVHIMIELANALSEVHRLGFAHGRLCPSRVGVANDGRLRLDVFDLYLGDFSPTPHDSTCLQIQDGSVHPQVADVYGLGMLSISLFTERNVKAPSGTLARDDAVTQVADAGSRLSTLLHEMIAPPDQERPSMHEVAARLQRADVSQLFTVLSPGVEGASSQQSSHGAGPPTPDPQSELEVGQELGRYRLDSLLGAGGMGKVFRATDMANENVVALKVLHSHWSRDDEALRRFYREARLLAQLDNPHIASFIDANEVDGRHYLAMEFVEGTSLHGVLQEETTLDCNLALSVTRDIALALADVHDLGIIHRDIKPANILLIGVGAERRAKLCDFGIARETETEQELTRAGLTVGTPHYMSPEQCVGDNVTAASDVYALGITLFKMLVGYVPFNAKDAQAIVYKHLAEPVPDVRTLAPETTEGAARILRRMLEKAPESRIPDARTLLDELEPVRVGRKTSIAAHPRLPEDAQGVITYDFEWQLSCTPAELWPHVSHTERLNRAIGLGAIKFSREKDDAGLVRTQGHLKLSGMTLDWREHPYEWVAPTRMGVLREFSAGPFIWLRSSVELVPHGNGTLLRHQVQVQPRGVLGKAAAAMEVGFKARKNLETVYRRIDQLVDAQRPVSSRRLHEHGPSDFADPFEDAPTLPRSVERRIDTIEGQLAILVAPDVAARLCDLVRHAPAQEIARIRPRVFARQHGFDHREVLRGTLHGAKLGLFVMLWDVICPRCRIPSNIVETLAALRDHDHCEACDLDFELDFGRSVEIIFRADPGLRESELGTFCIGGPGHTPHVIMQIRLAPGERFEADLMLGEGEYAIAGRQMAVTWGFSVRDGAPLRQWELSIASSEDRALVIPSSEPSTQRIIAAGRQRLILCNDTGRELVARIERAGGRADAITAAEAAATASFRELFPSEVLSPGHLISIGRVTLLIADADVWTSDDEASAFARLTKLSQAIAKAVEAAGGAVVKIHGDGVMAAFPTPASATRAALDLVGSHGDDMSPRIAVHTGPAMATSINDRLDYFGRVVRQAEELLGAMDPGAAAISETTYADAEVGDLLARVDGPLGLLATQEVVCQVVTASTQSS